MRHRFEDTVVTFANIPSTASETQIQHGYDVASAGTDILLTAEDHMRNADKYSGPEFLTLQTTVGHSKSRCSIHVLKRRYRVLKSPVVLLNRANGMTFHGASRWAKFARVQDMWTGRYWNLSSMHFVPHADRADKPGVITNMPRGKANVQPAITSIITKVLPDRVGQELGGVDCNIDLDGDLKIKDFGMVEQLNKVGLYTDVQKIGAVPDTHGRDEYDWIFGRFLGEVDWVPGSNVTLPKLNGLDHRFRRVAIRSSVRKNWKIPSGFKR